MFTVRLCLVSNFCNDGYTTSRMSFARELPPRSSWLLSKAAGSRPERLIVFANYSINSRANGPQRKAGNDAARSSTGEHRRCGWIGGFCVRRVQGHESEPGSSPRALAHRFAETDVAGRLALVGAPPHRRTAIRVRRRAESSGKRRIARSGAESTRLGLGGNACIAARAWRK